MALEICQDDREFTVEMFYKTFTPSEIRCDDDFGVRAGAEPIVSGKLRMQFVAIGKAAIDHHCQLVLSIVGGFRRDYRTLDSVEGHLSQCHPIVVPNALVVRVVPS